MNSITSIEKTNSTKLVLIDADINEQLIKDLKSSVANLLIYEYRRAFVGDLDIYKSILAKSFAFKYLEHQVPSLLENDCSKSDEDASKSNSLLNDTEFLAFFDASGQSNSKIFDDPSFVYMLLLKAKSLLVTMPNIRECDLSYEKHETEKDKDKGNESNSCIIVGDLCGSLNDFSYLVEEFGIPGLKHQFVFNGNLVRLDTHPKNQIDLLLLVCYVFVLRPDRVFINRGSHDDIFTSLVHMLDNEQPSFLQMIRQRYDVYSTAIFNAIIDLFGYLSLGTLLINNLTRMFIVNSGINDKINIEFIQNKIRRNEIVSLSKFDDELNSIRSMFESVPRRDNHKNDTDNELGYYRCFKTNALEFDMQQTGDFCELNDISCIIRSNEVVKDGFSIDHSKCFTVFSASNYYDSNNMGAILKLNANETALEPYVYNNNYIKTLSPFVSIQEKFKHLLKLKNHDLNAKFEIRDKLKTGSLRFDQFANVLAEYFGDLNILLVEELFKDEYDKETNKFKYSDLFSLCQHESYRHLKKILLNIFNMLDIDDDKRVSLSELKESLAFITDTEETSHLSYRNGCKSIIEKLNSFSFIPSSNSNEICLNEFQQVISSVLEINSILKDFNLGDDDESCKEFVISSENENENVSDAVEDNEEDGEEERNESDNEDDDSKSIDSESSEDGPLQLVRL